MSRAFIFFSRLIQSFREGCAARFAGHVRGNAFKASFCAAGTFHFPRIESGTASGNQFHVLVAVGQFTFMYPITAWKIGDMAVGTNDNKSMRLLYRSNLKNFHIP